MHDPEGPTTVDMPYNYYVQVPQAYHDGQTRVEGMAGLCTYGDITVRFLRPGACGAIITTKIGSAEKIIGHLLASNLCTVPMFFQQSWLKSGIELLPLLMTRCLH